MKISGQADPQTQRRDFLKKSTLGLFLLSTPAHADGSASQSSARNANGLKKVKEERRPALSISAIEISKLTIPYREPFRISLGLITMADNVLIKLETEAGIYGLGEGSPIGTIVGENQAIDFAAAIEFAKLIKGKNALAVEARMAEIDKCLVHNTAVKSAFDMALYDLLGKYADLPLYALLGGEKRAFYTDLTIGLDAPEKMAEKAVAIKKRGFPAIKVKLGTNLKDDVARVRAVREAIGDGLPIRADANQGWGSKVAVNILRSLEPYGIEYCEQPVPYWDHEALKLITEKTSIGIMADESLFDHHDALKLAGMRACDYFNVKLSKSSGIHTALKINGIAEAAGIKCMLGCMSESRLALSACAHLVSARTNFEFVDLDSALQLADDPVVGGLTYDQGRISFSDAPGHGADIDPSFLKKMEKLRI